MKISFYKNYERLIFLKINTARTYVYYYCYISKRNRLLHVFPSLIIFLLYTRGRMLKYRKKNDVAKLFTKLNDTYIFIYQLKLTYLGI